MLYAPDNRRLSVSHLRLSRRDQRYTADADWGVLDVVHIWCNLANTTEPSVCSGDAALYQMTLTNCYYYATTHVDAACSYRPSLALSVGLSR